MSLNMKQEKEPPFWSEFGHLQCPSEALMKSTENLSILFGTSAHQDFIYFSAPGAQA